MNLLSGFSEWVLALLPRLFLWPGGVYAVLGLALLYACNALAGRRSPRLLLDSLASINVPAAALAWVAIAIAPLGGLPPLTFPVDAFTLLALPAASLAFDTFASSHNWRQIAGTLAITTAALATVLPTRRLLAGGGAWNAPTILALVASALALIALSPETGQNLSRALRWFALGVVALSLAYEGPPLNPLIALGALTAMAVLGLIIGRIRGGRWSDAALILAWLAAVLAVLTALLVPGL